MQRKRALRRLNGLAPRIEEHFQKIADDAGSRDLPHWKSEIGVWLEQMEQLLPHVGDRTAEDWVTRIAEWKARLED